MAFSPGKLNIACDYSTEVKTSLIRFLVALKMLLYLSYKTYFEYMYMYQVFVRLTFRIHFNSISASPLYKLSINIMCPVFGVRIFFNSFYLLPVSIKPSTLYSTYQIMNGESLRSQVGIQRTHLIESVSNYSTS